uniref:Phosphoribosyltransferase domain-containing protein n=1 Tax=Anopheles farauti TaxID=69004 RepID=A0A182Q070_9DIPT
MCSANESNGTTSPVLSENPADYGENLKILDSNDQIKELQTIIRDKNTTRSDFKFYADRLIRLVIEESLNQLPYSDCSVITPTGAIYDGLRYRSGNCGVSIIRSGEAMEQAVSVLKDHGVKEHSIILSNLFCTPVAARMVVTAFPDLKILTSELNPVAPNHFGQKYFGTD